MDLLLIVLLILFIAVIFIFVIKHVLAVKCPECKSSSVHLMGTDDYDGTTQYYCNHCRHVFITYDW